MFFGLGLKSLRFTGRRIVFNISVTTFAVLFFRIAFFRGVRFERLVRYEPIFQANRTEFGKAVLGYLQGLLPVRREH